MNNLKSIEDIKKYGLPVVIFGAGIVGEALFFACEKAGIKVECFCDNNVNKTKNQVCNIEVLYVQNLKNKYKDAVFLISAADIKDVITQLNSMGYSKWCPCSVLLRNFDIHQYKFNVPMDFVEYAVGTGLLCHDSYLNPDKIFIRSVDIIITERCSLKCRDCSNLMQYYEKPRDCSIQELLLDIGNLCMIVDEVNEFRVIGGEPFMNKEFHLVIKRLVEEPKVKKIVVYTNGTILPKEEQLAFMKNEKLLIIITDYGKYSRKLEELSCILKENNIAFYAPKVKGWTACSKILKHNRQEPQQKEVFLHCCSKNVITLSDGKIYRCPFSANMDRLRAMPECIDDHINISLELKEGKGLNTVKKKVQAFLLEKQYLETCDYCNGRSFDSPEITPAIQTKVPLEYRKYLK